MAILRLRGARETPLFSAFVPAPNGETIVSHDGEVTLYRQWLAAPRADALLAHIGATTVWLQERRKMYDRFVDVPREQAWFGDDRELPFTEPLDAVRRELEALLATPFSHVLLNRYRDGNDSVAWHNDREAARMMRPTIASLTLGATRAFDLRPKAEPRRVTSIDLDHGDLVVMRGDTQTNYDHRVPKDPRVTSERINLTFRQQSV
jgi:alkylated DNA repair dioxygenase AlkB